MESKLKWKIKCCVNYIWWYKSSKMLCGIEVQSTIEIVAQCRLLEMLSKNHETQKIDHFITDRIDSWNICPYLLNRVRPPNNATVQAIKLGIEDRSSKKKIDEPTVGENVINSQNRSCWDKWWRRWKSWSLIHLINNICCKRIIVVNKSL